ncbi:type IX secretion system outer membrane channel protein PorV [Haloflavibacter putidus]|uniref:Type IX secretion system outer membrane channel protein PorV n=1 Tax=Haloflavibacter putidus TaxID=2576776 RepID=A0A507ZKW1_9FLAO|nr:type IX secretion system outer membrane channel protein PorV [Haloflavibacter putidus]TQD34352.1 type IX secretion system outer membrane channel protein PorV [Haloflavibacter putidus]
MRKITFLLLTAILFISNKTKAQDEITIKDRTITTAVPFLLISGDARASGMADQGVATPVDAYSQQWNPAKYVFSEKQQGVGISYVPYLRELANDINVGQVNYFNRINERSAFAASLRYFNLGEIEARDTPDQEALLLKPNQLSFDLTYALRLSEQFSMAVTGRYIRSDLQLQTSNEDASAANSFGVDVSAFYQSEEIAYSDFNGRWRGGINISNIGPKIKYDDAGQESFIPTNFKAGAGFDFILDAANTVGVYGEINKLLVPTPSDSNDDGRIDREDDWYNESPFGAIFSSWGDAPDGFSEELKEITWALGAEYRYEDSFAFRLGYFNESDVKGFRKFLSLGAGFKYSVINIDASYLFSTAKKTTNPLEGSLRFSLSFNFGEEYTEY